MSTQAQEQTETPQQAAQRIGASLMVDPRTSLEDLAEAGWVIESTGYTTYFRHRPTMAVLDIPQWANQMADICGKAESDGAKRIMREALGLEEKPEFRAI